MAALDTTAASAVLKVYYSNQRVQSLMYKDAPLYAMIEKVKDFYGSSYPLPMRLTNPQGAGNTFSSAQSNKTPSKFRTFQLTRASDYALASISTEAILASESNPGAFLKLATAEIDGALETLKRRLSWALYGDGTGSMGSVTGISVANPAVLTLTNAEDVVKFEVGQTLEARNVSTVRIFATSVSSAVVQSVNRDAGTVTVTVDNSGGTSTIVNNDTLNVVGDYNAKLTGLAGWIPSTAPTSTAFFGVDRSADPTRLGGIRLTVTGQPIDEALIAGARRAAREGGTPTHVFCGFTKYSDLEKTLGARVRYTDVEVAGIGFKAIEVPGPNGTLKIIPDRDCPENKMYMLDMASWALYSLKEPAMIVDLDGNKMLRDGAADSFEVRCASYSQLGCDRPGSNLVLIF